MIVASGPTTTTSDAYTNSAWYIAAVLAGAIFGWFLAQGKAIWEIKKLKTERAKLYQESIDKAQAVVERIQRQRDAHSVASRELTQRVQNLSRLFRDRSKNLDEFRTCRDGICSQLCDEVIRTFSNWAELFAAGKSGSELVYFGENILLREVKRWCDWMKIINHPPLKQKLSCNPLVVTASTLEPLRDLIRNSGNSDLAAKFNDLAEFLYKQEDN